MSGKIRAEYLTPTKTKTYLLPIFVEHLGLRYIKEIINSFIFVTGIEEEPIIAILYKYSDKIEYKLEGDDDSLIFYLEELKKSEFLLEGIELGDYSLFVFKLPEELYYAYSCLVEGKYSWLTPENKLTISKFLNRYYPSEKKIINKVLGILNKSPVIRKQIETSLKVEIPKEVELSSKIIPEDETINPKEALTEINI